MHSTVLRVENLTIGYGARTLVRDISFELASGECVLLAGPNGTGKTTLLKRIADVSREIPSSVSDLLGMTKKSRNDMIVITTKKVGMAETVIPTVGKESVYFR